MTGKSERVEFEVPAGANLPAGSEAGQQFDLVCSFQAKGNGRTVCMTQFGDTKMPGYDDAEKAEHKPDYEQYSKGMAETMMASGGNPAPATGGY